MAWVVLMQRAFELDVLASPRCGGWLRLIVTIADPVTLMPPPTPCYPIWRWA